MDAGKALTAAAAKGNTGEVQRILEECRVNPDTQNEFGKTALQVRMDSCFIQAPNFHCIQVKSASFV